MSVDPAPSARTPKALYRHRTRVGSFYIAPCRGGWEVQHGGAPLGSPWPTAEQALAELIGGRTHLLSSSDGVDLSTLGIDPSLDNWERLGWVTGQ